MKCEELNSQDKEACRCGGGSFVFGNNFTYSRDIGVVCDCVNNKFDLILHMNRNLIYDKTYKCI